MRTDDFAFVIQHRFEIEGLSKTWLILITDDYRGDNT